jgi:hypothetical protein
MEGSILEWMTTTAFLDLIKLLAFSAACMNAVAKGWTQGSEPDLHLK